MAEETQSATAEEQEAAGEEKEAKTYNDDEVNGIVKKSKAKARTETLKALGIEDEAWAKETLAAAKAQRDAQTAQTTTTRETELAAQLTAAKESLAQTAIEAHMLRAGVDPAKVERAARLVDRAKCSDEDGKFDPAKEVKAVLGEFPELLAAKTEPGKPVGLDMTKATGTAAHDTIARIFGNKT
jgi:hypothetical protein